MSHCALSFSTAAAVVPCCFNTFVSLHNHHHHHYHQRQHQHQRPPQISRSTTSRTTSLAQIPHFLAPKQTMGTHRRLKKNITAQYPPRLSKLAPHPPFQPTHPFAFYFIESTHYRRYHSPSTQGDPFVSTSENRQRNNFMVRILSRLAPCRGVHHLRHT